MKTTRQGILFAVLACCTFTSVVTAAEPERVAVLTFDDSVRSHATFVAPLLEKYGFGATFFICEFPPEFADKTKYMTWEQIRSLHEMGFEIANHTRTHAHVNKMSESQMDRRTFLKTVPPLTVWRQLWPETFGEGPAGVLPQEPRLTYSTSWTSPNTRRHPFRSRA